MGGFGFGMQFTPCSWGAVDTRCLAGQVRLVIVTKGMARSSEIDEYVLCWLIYLLRFQCCYRRRPLAARPNTDLTYFEWIIFVHRFNVGTDCEYNVRIVFCPLNIWCPILMRSEEADFTSNVQSTYLLPLSPTATPGVEPTVIRWWFGWFVF